MPLHRPARFFRQHVPHSTTAFVPIRYASSSQIVRPDQPVTPELDPSFAPFLKSIDLTARRRPTSRNELQVVEGRLSGTSSSKKRFGIVRDEVDFDKDADGDVEGTLGHRMGGRREERRSPATVLGSKRLGIAVLPEELVDAVQGIIDGQSSSSLTFPS